MTAQFLQQFLWKCIIVNILFLLLLTIVSLFTDYLYPMHSYWFVGSEAEFKSFFYSMIAYYKLAFIFFNVVPYIAIKMMKEIE